MDESKKKVEFDKYDKFGAYHWENISNDLKKHQLHENQQYRLIVDLTAKGKILDVGCGDGVLSHLLAKNGSEVHGIDLSKTAISLAKARTRTDDYIKRPKFFVDSMYTYKPKIKYDVIILCDVIEHIPDASSAIKNLKKLIKQNGQIIITTPLKENNGQLMDRYHVKEYTKKDFENLLNNHFGYVMVQGAFSSWLINFYKKCGYSKVWVYIKLFLNYLSINGFNFRKLTTKERGFKNLIAICK